MLPLVNALQNSLKALLILEKGKSHFDKGWVEVAGRRLCLSGPQGFLFSNVVLAELFEKSEE
ncbi:hypothetical protein A6770_07765 [Nostoc minutum NIES-26]|uniref:Uncharacterized protein n=1 Tax=Nostoc minutum NIES-26 TaxID=1844469 RepID=A0A367S452_9NOSO|nr:hypothetical protein A6770_07765 [Nostoc minutum NIES-26]